MTDPTAHRYVLTALRGLPLFVFLAVVAIFAPLSDRFLQPANFVNILIQAAPIAVVAMGMTFVLLTGGIDLSVGAVMYLTACLLGIYLKGKPLPLSVLGMAAVGLAFGAANALFVTFLRVPAFIVTLSTLFIGRGLALYLSGTKMVFFPPPVTSLNRWAPLGVPFALWMFAGVFLVTWTLLRRTPFGRQVYAVGADPVVAAKAGLKVRTILFSVYCLCAVCAALGGFLSVTQVGAVSASFALEREFAAVAAAVLGGTSLFGGRGGVEGTAFGAILVQTVANGLVVVNANPYVYPLVTAAIIFLAVLADSLRERVLKRLQTRQIRLETATA